MAGCGMAFAGAESSPVASGWSEILTPGTWIATLVFLVCSAFFSSAELAFFSLHQLRLRSMRESAQALDRLVARLMVQWRSLRRCR